MPVHKHQVLTVTPLPNQRLFVVFTDKSRKLYDTNILVGQVPGFERLKADPHLFYGVYPVAKGDGIVWDDDLDLSSDELYINGCLV